jgi:hypothetical protein
MLDVDGLIKVGGWFNESGVVVVGFNLNINVEWPKKKKYAGRWMKRVG